MRRILSIVSFKLFLFLVKKFFSFATLRPIALTRNAQRVPEILHVPVQIWC